jgi:hypothetical protein
MITLEPIGFVRSSRSGLSDDDWGGVTARIELVESLPAESLDGIEAFSHAEVVYYFDRVPDAEVERGARHPRGNTAWPKVGICAQRGITPLRQQQLAWLEGFAGVAEECGYATALGSSARALAARLRERWPPDVVELPLYPAFRG